MNNIRTAKAMFLTGMIAATAPMGTTAAETQDNLQQEIIEQGNTALEAMSARLVHEMNWSQQVSRQLAEQIAEQTFTPKTAVMTECPQAITPMEHRAGHGDKNNPPATPGGFRTAGITHP